MYDVYWNGWNGFTSGQQGWFWGVEKQAAVGVLTQYEDYKGLIDELRFWSIAKSPTQLANNWQAAVTGSETGLVGWYTSMELRHEHVQFDRDHAVHVADKRAERLERRRSSDHGR